MKETLMLRIVTVGLILSWFSRLSEKEGVDETRGLNFVLRIEVKGKNMDVTLN